MPSGYLVSLGNNSLDTGDGIGGGLITFVASETLGAGSWSWSGTWNGSTFSNEIEPGVYFTDAAGNVYFVPDYGPVDTISSASALNPPAYVTSDGTVSGTSGDDVIDESYTGDPDGDQVTASGDVIDAGDGNDSIVAGTGDDTVMAGSGADTVIGGDGRDSISGDSGNDVIYGDSDAVATTGTETLHWLDAGVAGTDISGGFVQDTGTMQVGVSFSNDGSNTAIETSSTTQFIGTQTLDTNSALFLTGNGGPNCTTTLEFNAEVGSGLANSVEDVVFRINDVDISGWQDIVTVNAYDEDGNAVAVTLTAEDPTNDVVSGQTVTANGTSDSASSQAGSVLVQIAGPIHSIEIVYSNGGTVGQALWITDLNYTTVAAPGGADSISGGAGDDLIYGGAEADVIDGGADNDTIFGDDGDDTVFGGLGSDTLDGGNGNDLLSGEAGSDTLLGGVGDDTLFGGSEADTMSGDTGSDSLYGGAGNDRFLVDDTHETSLIEGGEDLDGNDVDTLTLDASTTTNGVDVTFVGNETGGFTYGGTTGSGAFSEIERIETTADADTIDAGVTTTGTTLDTQGGDDSVIGGSGDDNVTLGTGSDTIDAGAGDDTITLGDGSGPDGAADRLILSDGDGVDIIAGFDAPTPNGDGTYTGIDTFDVSALTDAAGDPVNTNDVAISDDGSGHVVLSFPNGEAVTLIGITPAQADNPFFLNAIGIPLPDGTVSGTAGDDLIDAAYLGDPDGDMVDAGDAILPGDTGDDDLIEAGGGNDTVYAETATTAFSAEVETTRSTAVQAMTKSTPAPEATPCSGMRATIPFEAQARWQIKRFTAGPATT